MEKNLINIIMYHNNQYKFTKDMEKKNEKKERKKPKKKLHQLFDMPKKNTKRKYK